MNKASLLLSLTLALALIATSASADTMLISKFTDDELVNILKNDGYKSVEKLEDGVLIIQIGGSPYILFNNDDGDLQTYYGLDGANISLEVINEWNRTKRLSRAYLDSSLDPILEADLLANGGLTDKHVTEFMDVFVTSVQLFKCFVSKYHQEQRIYYSHNG